MREIQFALMTLAFVSGGICHGQESIAQDSVISRQPAFGTSDSKPGLLSSPANSSDEFSQSSEFTFNKTEEPAARDTPPEYSPARQKIVQRTMQFAAIAVVIVVAGIAGFLFQQKRKRNDPFRRESSSRSRRQRH